MAHLLPPQPIHTLDAYLDIGGGSVMEQCHTLGRDGVIETIRNSGLRGRGGGGFPTGIKWAGVAGENAPHKFVVCNAAEGEPGTFKDRLLLRRNPYQVLEGIAAAVYATGADTAYIGIKAKFTSEIAALERAAAELAATGRLGEVSITIVPGPDDYLFGEEKAMLEVIEGKDPLPRLYPPYVQGLFEKVGGPLQPAVVNNVETLANVPHILTHGAEWYRSMGTDDSPGTMVSTVSGDVHVEAVAEVEMGTRLRVLLDTIGGGVDDGRTVKMVMNGVSTSPIRPELLDTPIAYETLRSIGSALGSAGFMVFDDTRCAVQIAAAASAFLFRGSCGQCPPCKLGTAGITEGLATLLQGGGDRQTVGEIAAWTVRVTDANRCGLGAGQRAVAEGLLDGFQEDIAHHLDGAVCPPERAVRITTIEDWDETAGRFAYSAPVLDDAPGA